MHKVKRTLPGAAFGFFHDIAVTDNYYVLLQNVRALFVGWPGGGGRGGRAGGAAAAQRAPPSLARLLPLVVEQRQCHPASQHPSRPASQPPSPYSRPY